MARGINILNSTSVLKIIKILTHYKLQAFSLDDNKKSETVKVSIQNWNDLWEEKSYSNTGNVSFYLIFNFSLLYSVLKHTLIVCRLIGLI